MMVPYPASALFFYQILISFANIDLMGTYIEDNIITRLTFVETAAYNQKFENYDIG